MFYDLNVPWTANDVGLQRTLSFLDELGYNVVALSHNLVGKLPTDLTSPVPKTLPFSTPPNLRLLRRCTLVLSDPSQNHRLAGLASHYDILALRPTNEKSLQLACQSLDCEIISLDLTTRFDFHFKMKMLAVAVDRGVKFEMCYSPGVLASDSNARRNLISNATQLIRATRGRGLIISSEAARAVGCRGPWDVINLAAVWGLGQERGKDAVSKLARSVVVSAQLKRTSFRGAVDVVYGGEKSEVEDKGKKGREGNAKTATEGDAAVVVAVAPTVGKRKADSQEPRTGGGGGGGSSSIQKPMSKREQKRQKKAAMLMETDEQTPTNKP